MRCYWLGMSGLSIPSAGLALARTQETEKLCQLGQGTLIVNNVNKLGYSTSLHGDLRSDYSRPLPLLLIHGRQDKLINAEALVKVIRPHFKDLRVHLLPDCGHVPFVEKSDKVATLISDFVQEICETKKRSVSHLARSLFVCSMRLIVSRKWRLCLVRDYEGITMICCFSLYTGKYSSSNATNSVVINC
jgi:hypothetical protein